MGEQTNWLIATGDSRVLLGSTVSGWLEFFVFYWGKPFSLGLVDHLFQPASSQVETVEKAFA